MKSNIFIVTVINSISETSMPYNEFVLYSYNNDIFKNQAVIVIDNNIPNNICIPDGLKIFKVGKNIKNINKIMNEIEEKCKKEGMKLIIHIHHPKAAFIFNISTILKKYRSKTVFTIHSLFNAYSYKNKILSFLATLTSKKSVCVSDASYNCYPSIIKKIKRKDILVVKNGVDMKRIDSVVSNIKAEIKDSKVKTIVYVARMIPIKNHIFLIEVIKNVENFKLVLIGEEDKKSEIRKKINLEGLGEKIEILGLIERNKVFEYLSKADIYVSPSLIEGLPISILEAMYLGLPVVMSNISPHKEICECNENIDTVPLELNKWIEILNKYCNLNYNDLKKIGQEFKKCAEENFSLDVMLEKYSEIYEEI